jgi:uncharacterized repeat protein (TIGR01451 family)
LTGNAFRARVRLRGAKSRGGGFQCGGWLCSPRDNRTLGRRHRDKHNRQTATITHADQFDPDTGNNTASATETPLRADLAVAKTVSNPTPNVGDVITFTVTLTDLGPATATNVSVRDLRPAGLTLVTATPSQGSYDPTIGLWAIGTVTTATAETLTLRTRVDSANTLTNTATINHADQFDPDPSNNSASASVN